MAKNIAKNIAKNTCETKVCDYDTEEFQKEATRVSMVSIVGNLVLALFKFMAGVIAHSTAMISDAVHSSSDVFSSVVVIIGVKMAAKDSDKEHPYGHERLECVAAIILATVLLITGIFIGYFAIHTINSGDYENVKTPGVLALVAAFISIVGKEAMYWYTRYYAKKIDSSALMADAWHHRSDALSSVGALIGILGARLGVAFMEPLASLVICVFIVKAAFDIYVEAIDKMVDKACDEETEDKIREYVKSQEGIIQIDLLQTRVFGNKIYVDLEIGVDEDLSLKEAHDIAERVHEGIENEFPSVKHIMVHVNPV